MGRPKKNPNPKGLGDVVENFTHATGIDKVAKAILGDDCGCEERKQKLNDLFPLSRKIRQCLNDEDRAYLKEFFDSKVNTIHPLQQRLLKDVYLRVFDIRLEDTSCSSCWRDYINDLKRAYDN